MTRNLIFLVLLLQTVSCGDPPEITKNSNPFPNPSFPATGIIDRLAAEIWSWENVPLEEVEDTEDQDEADQIFHGVEIDFRYDPVFSADMGNFRYKNGDGRVFRGEWHYDLVDNILTMTFDDHWGTPILTRHKTALFDVHEVTNTVLEMRFTELDESRKAVLIFIHKG